MELIKDEFEAANRRAGSKLRQEPSARAARYDRKRGRVVIALDTGIELAFRPHDLQGLERATPRQLEKIEISPSGLGLHFPKANADLYIPALLEGFLGSKRWIAAQSGKKGGSVSTQAKAAAARRNGSLGGRPKKSKQERESARRLARLGGAEPRLAKVPRRQSKLA